MQVDIKTIVGLCGGDQALADKLGISRQAVNKWKRVPVAHVRQISQLSGLAWEAIRADVYPPDYPTMRAKARAA